MFAEMRRRDTDGLFLTRIMSRSEHRTANLAPTVDVVGKTHNRSHFINVVVPLRQQSLARVNRRIIRAVSMSKRYGTTDNGKPSTCESVACVLIKHTKSS